MHALRNEWRVFLSHPRDMRVLIVANMVFAMVTPVLDVFVAAYVLRNSHDASKVVQFQLAVYTGIPIAFLLAGFLMRRLPLQWLYATGMLITGLSIVALMGFGQSTPHALFSCGLFMGLAFGLFAACRTLLAQTNTDNDNRNYYYGVELFGYTLTSVLVPLIVGWLVHAAPSYGWFDGAANGGYRALAGGALALALVAAAVVVQGRYRGVVGARFLYARIHPLWRRMMTLAVLKGLAQGYIVTIPAMLILMLVGHEGVLGSVVSVGGVCSALVMYAIGRLARPRHRLAVFATGLLVFLAGGLFNCLWFNAAGALALTLCLLLSKPLLDVAYFPMQLQLTDVLSKLESRFEFAYLFTHECAEYVGRLAGCGLFLALALHFSAAFALRYALLAIGVTQLLSFAIARRLSTALHTIAPHTGTTRLN